MANSQKADTMEKEKTEVFQSMTDLHVVSLPVPPANVPRGDRRGSRRDMTVSRVRSLSPSVGAIFRSSQCARRLLRPFSARRFQWPFQGSASRSVRFPAYRLAKPIPRVHYFLPFNSTISPAGIFARDSPRVLMAFRSRSSVKWAYRCVMTFVLCPSSRCTV